MKTVTLGRTGLAVPQVGFGALPIQRTASPEAERIIFKAYTKGVRFFDTARIQRESELDEFLALDAAPPKLTPDLEECILKDQRELGGAFCRGCGYCLPCPAKIPIHWAARMPQLLRRAPAAVFLAPDWQQQMERIEECTDCRSCVSRCPYQLDTPLLLKAALMDYRTFF